jgi:hypothetical protein
MSRLEAFFTRHGIPLLGAPDDNDEEMNISLLEE